MAERLKEPFPWEELQKQGYCLLDKLDKASNDRPAEFEIMDRLNALEKYPDCGRINENLIFTFSRGVWCVNVERKLDGFGYWYKSLDEAVKRWNVEIFGFNNGVWIGKPI